MVPENKNLRVIDVSKWDPHPTEENVSKSNMVLQVEGQNVKMVIANYSDDPITVSCSLKISEVRVAR